jgi:UDP-sugar transporter A1/2/3
VGLQQFAGHNFEAALEPQQQLQELDSHTSPWGALILIMSSDGARAVFFCGLLALQFGLQPLLAGRYTGAGVSKSSVVIATELCKILLAAASLAGESGEERQSLVKSWTLIDSLKVAAVPAVLYAIQNLFSQYGYALLDSMTFNLLNQTKTISTAFWVWVLIGNPQSVVQTKTPPAPP